MRLHTNTVTIGDVQRAVYAANAEPLNLGEHGSRTHTRAFELTLTGDSPRQVNGGVSGAGGHKAATWDQWGIVLGGLFEIDSEMTVTGVYRGAGHFHEITGGRFDHANPYAVRSMRDDGYRRTHRWEYRAELGCQECDCGAVQVYAR